MWSHVSIHCTTTWDLCEWRIAATWHDDPSTPAVVLVKEGSVAITTDDAPELILFRALTEARRQAELDLT